MNMEKYLRVLKTHVVSHKLNLGDGESILSLLYEACYHFGEGFSPRHHLNRLRFAIVILH